MRRNECLPGLCLKISLSGDMIAPLGNLLVTRVRRRAPVLDGELYLPVYCSALLRREGLYRDDGMRLLSRIFRPTTLMVNSRFESTGAIKG